MQPVLILMRTICRSSVRISDDCSTVVVGAFGSDTCGVFSGAAYVYLADELGSRNPHLMNWQRGANPRKHEGRMVCRRCPVLCMCIYIPAHAYIYYIYDGWEEETGAVGKKDIRLAGCAETRIGKTSPGWQPHCVMTTLGGVGQNRPLGRYLYMQMHTRGTRNPHRYGGPKCRSCRRLCVGKWACLGSP